MLFPSANIIEITHSKPRKINKSNTKDFIPQFPLHLNQLSIVYNGHDLGVKEP